MRLILGCLVVLLSLSNSVASSSTFELVHTFQAEVPEAGDWFGTAVVLEGGFAAIKSNSGYADGDSRSITHVFEQSSTGDWPETATLQSHFTEHPESEGFSDTSNNPYIGQELAIDSGEIIISYGLKAWPNPLHGFYPLQIASRSADGWSVKFNEPTPITHPGRFAVSDQRLPGRTVDASNGYAIIESTFARRPDGGSGVASVYERSPKGEWHEVANLFPESGKSIVPIAVAIDGTTAAVVDRQHGNGGLYFFERQPSGNWIQTEEFLDDSEIPSFYPHLVEIDGNTAVTRSMLTGTLQIYQREGEGWVAKQEIVPPSYDSRFQGGFAIDNGILAHTVGGSEALGNEDLQIELYRQSASGDWENYALIPNPNPDFGISFGASLALDNGRLLVGASSASSFQLEPPGAAYLFEMVPEPSSFAQIVVTIVCSWSRSVRYHSNRAS